MNKIYTIYLNIRLIIKQLLGLVKFSDQYAAEWTKDSIKWYINNELVKVFNIKTMKDYEIPTHPMYIIINEGVHEDRLLLNASKLPEGMEVDWIRVYK